MIAFDCKIEFTAPVSKERLKDDINEMPPKHEKVAHRGQIIKKRKRRRRTKTLTAKFKAISEQKL